MITTSKKDFQLFKTEFLKWAENLGLTDIHFNFVHMDICECAYVIGDINQKAYVVTLGKTFVDMEVLPLGFIEYLAYHEAMECVLYELRTLAGLREYNENTINSSIHNIINRFEKTFKVKNNFTVIVEGQ
jgi:hypothetical protein